MKRLKYWENYQNMAQRHKLRKCCWKNGAKRLAIQSIATNLQFEKKKKQYL